jgi:radical SAM protein with 4Fe4S-binding SPASM domain
MEMFWMIPKEVEVLDFDFDLYFNHHNLYDRNINHVFQHKFRNELIYNGISCVPKNKKLSKKEIDFRFPIEKKQYEIVASKLKPYDIVFISYNEPNADENYEKLKSKFPRSKRVHGIKGIHNAHKAAAEIADTNMFYAVDGDAEIVDDFKFDHEVSRYERDIVFIWQSINPINDLVYGYGGVKLLPKDLVLSMNTNTVDMTLSISTEFRSIATISNITKFNTDPFNTWKSAFRECVKLATKPIDKNYDEETDNRLETWCTKGADRPFGKFALQGATLGKTYGLENIENPEALFKINDFDWLREQYGKDRTIKSFDRKTICAIPWMHLNFEPNGKVVPCCLTSTFEYFAGDLNDQTVDEIWNSENMKSLRRTMIEGKQPEICIKCFSAETSAGYSGRTRHNEEFNHVIDSIPKITDDDGTCHAMDLRYWDFRFSNLCNFKCRSCGPRYSSSWVPDAKKMGWVKDQEKVWNIQQVGSSNNYEFLEEQIQTVEKIYFAGGEPLLMDEHWYILDLLQKYQRYDVKISYNTNLSTLIYKKKNILDIWSKWQPGKLEIWPSVDEIGDRAELIRSGTVWKQVENNLIELSKLPNIHVRPAITAGAMNVFRLPEIIDYLISIGVITSTRRFSNFYLNLLEWPSHYHVHILSEDFRKQIVSKINNFIQTHNERYVTDVRFIFLQILFELSKPYDKSQAQQFVEITKRLDHIRNENIFNTIPELTDVLTSLEESGF